MKRFQLFLAIAMLCTMASSLFAQTNYALASNGASATAASGDAAAAIDGNENSLWVGQNGDWWLLNLGQSRTFNAIQIKWEGAYTKTFTIETSADEETWTPLISIEGQSQPKNLLQDLFFDDVTAQYIRFTAIEALNAGWGNKFYEFRVFNYPESPLAVLNLEAESPICKVGESVKLSFSGTDTYGRPKEIAPTYTITPATAGTIKDNVFTAAETGVAQIVASYDEMSSEPIYIACYSGANLAKGALKEESGHDGNNDASKALDGDEGSQWVAHAGTAGSEEARTYDAWFTIDLGGFYSIDLITIKYEGACAQDYHIDFSTDYENWQTGYNYVGKNGIDGRKDVIYAPALTNVEEVRYIRYYMTKAATEYGMKMYEFQVYGTLIPDTEKPVMLGAELIDSTYYSLTYRLKYTDNLFVARCLVEDKDNFISSKYAVSADSLVVINGLIQNHAYNFSFRALDGSGNMSDEAVKAAGHTTRRYTEPQTAAETPDVPADQVIAIYSDAYTIKPTWDSYKADWGDATVLKEIKVAGDNMLQYTNINWLGWTCSSAIDASIMEKLHLDIWSERACVLEITPIYGGAGLNTDDKQTYKASLQAQRWNSVDIDLQKDLPNLNLSSIFQMKFGGLGLGAIVMDNVYFYRTTPYVDTEAPTNLQVKAAPISYNSATLVISAEDNGPSITYTILQGTNKLGTVAAKAGAEVKYALAGLKMDTEYTYSVFGTDFAGLTSDTVTITFSTLAAPQPGPAPTPIQPAENVSSIYSDHYKPFTYFWPGNWYQKTQSTYVPVAEKDTAILLTEFDYLGWEINNNVPMNMTRHSYLHIDLYAPVESSITVLPISKGLPDNVKGVTLDLVADEWNSFNLLMDDFVTDFKQFLQLKFSDATGSVFMIDNVYFWGYQAQGIENTDVEGVSLRKVLRDGQLYIEVNGVYYTVTGARVR